MPPSIRSNYSGLPRHLVSKQSAPSSSAGSFFDPRHEYVPVVITTKDLQASLTAFETLLGTAKAYRNAMLALANATSAFAAALEECARQKGAMSQSTSDHALREEDEEDLEGQTAKETVTSPPLMNDTSPAEKLMAAAGLHHLLGNHNQILSDSFYRQFEVPLMEEYDNHRRVVGERQASYEKATQEKAKVIRETESRNIKMGRKKQRDLASFRKALAELQAHVNDLDNLKIEHYSEVYEGEQDMWHNIAGKTSVVVRREIEMYDKIVTKGSADPVLDAMGQLHPDPFQAYAQKEDSAQMFSILPPLSMLTPAQTIARTSVISSTHTPTSSTPNTPPMRHHANGEEADINGSPVKPEVASPITSASPSTPKQSRPLSMIQEIQADGSFDAQAGARPALNAVHSKSSSQASIPQSSHTEEGEETARDIDVNIKAAENTSVARAE